MSSSFSICSVLKRSLVVVLFTISSGFYIYPFNPRVQFYRSQLEDTTISNSARIEYYDSLLAMNPSDRPHLLYKKASALRRNGNLKEALNTYREAYSCGVLLGERERLESLYAIGAASFDVGSLLDALREVSNLIAIPKHDSLKFYNVKGWLTVYNVHMSLGNVPGASKAISSGMKELERVKPFLKEKDYNIFYGVFQMMNGNVNSSNKKYKEAFENYQQAGKLLDKDYQGTINLSIGLLFSQQDEDDLSLNFYKKAIDDEYIDPRNRAAACLNYVVNLVDLKRFDEALDGIKKYDSQLSLLYGTVDESKVLSIISEAYEGKKEWKTALEYRNKAIAVMDSLISVDLRNDVGSLISEIESLSSQNEMEEKTLASLWNNWLFRSLVIFAVLLIAVIVMLFIRYRKSKKNAVKCSYALKEAENKVDRLYEANEDKKLAIQELSVYKARMSNIAGTIEDLRKMTNNPKTHKSEIVSAVEKTARSLAMDANVWEPFMAYAEGASQEFFDKLYLLHPDLSNSETRMCAFILLSRTTKEIAAILNRSPRTVESIKYNLRVKLRIKDMTTEQYLRKISATPLSELVAP